MPTSFIELLYPIDISKTVTSHGWRILAPFGWDDALKVLSHKELINRQVVEWKVASVSNDLLSVDVSQGIESTIMDAVIKRVRRSLMVEWDPKDAVRVASHFNPGVSSYIAAGGGRFLRGSTFYEDFLKTICTINTTWANTKMMTERLVANIGMGASPSPTQVLDAAEQLKPLVRLGYRSELLVDATNQLLSQGLLSEDGSAQQEVIGYEDLIALRGIGPYAANHMAVLQSDYSTIPVDSEVRSFFQTKKGESEVPIEETFANWGIYKFLGYKLGRIVSQTNWAGD